MRNIKGLLETIEAQRPPDAIAGQAAKGIGFAMYPTTLEQIEQLKATVGISNRSHLLRVIIDFANNHQSEFVEFLAAANPEVKAG